MYIMFQRHLEHDDLSLLSNSKQQQNVRIPVGACEPAAARDLFLFLVNGIFLLLIMQSQVAYRTKTFKKVVCALLFFRFFSFFSSREQLFARTTPDVAIAGIRSVRGRSENDHKTRPARPVCDDAAAGFARGVLLTFPRSRRTSSRLFPAGVSDGLPFQYAVRRCPKPARSFCHCLVVTT